MLNDAIAERFLRWSPGTGLLSSAPDLKPTVDAADGNGRQTPELKLFR